MDEQASAELHGRAVTIAMMLMTYVGLYMEAPDEAVGLMATDSTLGEVFPSDAMLGVMLALTWVAAAGDLDSKDVRVIGQSVIDGMNAG